jgi:hypothetical protein
MVEESNAASVHIAKALGYVDTGLREFSGEGRLRQPPTQQESMGN